MRTRKRAKKIISLAGPPLAVAGSVGALTALRNRFQQQRLFLPDRYPNGIWDPEPFGLEVEDVWFYTADGEELHGWWIVHPKARGTILFCHGNTGSIAHQIGMLRTLRRLKMNILAFDYRGYGRSTGSPSEKGLCQDVQAAHDYLLAARGERPDRMILLGHSLGGAVAIDCARNRPVAGLIVQASFTNVREATRSAYPGVPLHLAARNQFRSIDKVGSIEIPKLFVHGSEDGKIPFAVGRRLYEAACDPKVFLEIPRAGHNDLHQHGGLRYIRALTRFRNRCLDRKA